MYVQQAVVSTEASHNMSLDTTEGEMRIYHFIFVLGLRKGEQQLLCVPIWLEAAHIQYLYRGATDGASCPIINDQRLIAPLRGDCPTPERGRSFLP